MASWGCKKRPHVASAYAGDLTVVFHPDKDPPTICVRHCDKRTSEITRPDLRALELNADILTLSDETF